MLLLMEVGWLYWKVKKDFIYYLQIKDKGLCEIKNVIMIFRKVYLPVMKLFKRQLKNILLLLLKLKLVMFSTLLLTGTTKFIT
jgi:hypothetical protein